MSMTRSDHFYIVRRELPQVLFDHVPEGHHDLGIVALGGLINASFIGNVEIGRRNMGAEKVTTEKDPVFFQICHHGLRPVNPGSMDKLQGLVTERQGVAILDGYEGFLGYSQKIDKHSLCPGCRYQSGIGVFFKNLRDCSGVILLGMV